MKPSQIDLFGKTVVSTKTLRERFIEPPFSVLDTKKKLWIDKKREWIRLGIKSEIGRKSTGHNTFEDLKNRKNKTDVINRILKIGGQSIFDPVLTELMYTWFCPPNGIILDPFAGGSVRGIVAHSLGYKYLGIELREEQVESNREQAKAILPDTPPQWICGDSNQMLDCIDGMFDFILTCPPYVNLEVYSDLKEDLSNMEYPKFIELYRSIISKSIKLLRKGCYAVFVVGEVRDKKGHYYGFVPDTIKIFQELGMKFYNECILLNTIGSASLRANTNMKNQKLVKIHQNVLCFKKI